MSEKIKCSECNYCTDIRGYGNKRGSFYCEHPDYDYLYQYFQKHRIKKSVGFIGFGERFSEQPSIKFSPAWCPKKAGRK